MRKSKLFHNTGCIMAALIMAMTFMASCQKTYMVPQSAIKSGEQVLLFPDYTEVTIPSNIAPLNFMIKNDGDEFVVEIKVAGKTAMVSGASQDGIVEFDTAQWHSMLKANRGKSLQVTVYANKDGQWVSFNPYNIYVAQEDIDPYLSYRLIEPGYELYRQLGLYQRNLTTFEQRVIYENNRRDISDENHCVNCHNFQNYGGKKMLFHVRASMGGTIIAKDGKIEKIDFKNDSTLGSAVYPSWHPKKNYIVFSSNRTGQAFHMTDSEKIEVLDYGSDLLFYNADTHEVSNILKTDGAMETFPTWAPDGKKIYFCQADEPLMAGMSDSLKINYLLKNYREVRYNLMSVTFDDRMMTFGEPRVEVDCAAVGKSATVPRVSPDGRFLLFTLGDFGQFHIWHKSSDLYVKNLQTGEIYALNEANSPDVDSYHSWSSNGRWIAFSSRRDDGSYTRLYITYFDKSGKARKAFMLPQEDPETNVMLLKSYNVPELTNEPVAYTKQQFRDAIYTQNPGISVKYKELRTPQVIASQHERNVRDRNAILSENIDNNSPNIHSTADNSATRRSASGGINSASDGSNSTTERGNSASDNKRYNKDGGFSGSGVRRTDAASGASPKAPR